MGFSAAIKQHVFCYNPLHYHHAVMSNYTHHILVHHTAAVQLSRLLNNEIF
jgi:hypothetical protein